MNAYKNVLRIWIAVTSMVGFIFGWVFFSRTTEPVTQIGSTTITMQDIPAVPTVIANENQPASFLQTLTFDSSSMQQQQMFQPPMRTGGS